MPAFVSNKGRFKSTQGVVSTPKRRADGYSRVRIHKKAYYLHRLIALAFYLPRLKGQNEVNHKNKKITDEYDYLENLEWCTHPENIQHSFKTGGRRSSAPKRSKPLRGRKKDSNDEWVTYKSASDAARCLGLDPGHIRAVVRGKQHQTGGYEFETLNEWSTLEGEEWRPTLGGFHVSSFGRIRTQRGVEYMPTPAKDGYCYVQIEGKGYLVHRLVAREFLPPPPDTYDSSGSFLEVPLFVVKGGKHADCWHVGGINHGCAPASLRPPRAGAALACFLRVRALDVSLRGGTRCARRELSCCGQVQHRHRSRLRC